MSDSYNFDVNPPKDISDAALRISPDILQRLNQVWRAFPDKDIRFVLVNRDEWDRCTKLTREAAEEITSLRAGLRIALDQRDEAKSKLGRIMEGLEGCCMTCVPIGVRNQQLQQDIKTLQSTDETMQLRQQVAELRAERDALRRTLARMYMDPNAFATAKGWDCFERETE